MFFEFKFDYFFFELSFKIVRIEIMGRVDINDFVLMIYMFSYEGELMERFFGVKRIYWFFFSVCFFV